MPFSSSVDHLGSTSSLRVIPDRNLWVLLACVLIAMGAFLIDVFALPLGTRTNADIGLGSIVLLGYAAALLASLWLSRWEDSLYVAIGVSALILFVPGYLLFGSIEGAEAIIPRRLLALALLWTVAVVFLQIERGTQTVEARLKARVEERTTELRLIESRLNEAQRIANIGSWDWNLVTGEQWWSEEHYRLAGRNPESFTPTRETSLEIVHPEDRQRVVQAQTSAQTAGEPYSVEYRLVLPDGSVRNMHSRGEVFYDQEGSAVRMAGTTQDITDRVALEREVVSAGEHERDRIGDELHDNLGQELAIISYGLTSVSRELEREQSPQTKAVQDLAKLTQESIEEAQRLARAFSPELSSRLGFKPALIALVANVNKYSKVTCHAHCSDEDDDPYDLEVATHLYRIAQEAINNALKHSGAQNIELRYGRDGDSIFLEVLDDGTGIPAKESRDEGMGLRSMRYRARILRGRLDVAAGTHGGTRVLCSCPAQPQ